MIEEDARTITIVKSLSTKRERSDVFLYGGVNIFHLYIRVVCTPTHDLVR